MEYERIHKVQIGVMSPATLRMKLLGSHGMNKKDEASKSPRASPSKLDVDHPKNSLLAQDFGEGRLEDPKDNADASRSESDTSHGRTHNAIKGGSDQAQQISSSSTVHPMRSLDTEGGNGNGNCYDSGHDNSNAGNFEFHREERTVQQPVIGPFFRQVPSKWNDAEKWIMGRHIVHSNPIFSKKATSHNQGGVRVAPESIVSSEVKKSSSNSLSSRSVVSGLTELSSSVSGEHSSVSGPLKGPHHNHKKLHVSARPASETTVSSCVQSVSMRDIGTEMTPIASQEQSRTGTPIGATTPTLSPLCSMPSSPKGGRSASSSASERELQIRTRREIAALGMQLGKMNIASWASKEDFIQASPDKSPDEDLIEKEEFEARAAAWEESRKCKLMSRYQRKEVKIQEWESHQKAKFEAKMRSAQAQAEQRKARAQCNLTERLSVLRHKVEGKQATAEARRNRQAARLARQVERIRKTGRVPSQFRCCSWFL